MNTFYNTKRVLSEEDIIQIETKYHFVMPLKIKKHYLKYNGGYPERCVFKVHNDDIQYVVDWFYSIGCEEGNTIESILPLLRDDGVFPQWLIPLADEEGGNLFAYSIRKGEEGAIYYYSHEFDYGENPEDHIILLAPNIDVFLDSLTFEEE